MEIELTQVNKWFAYEPFDGACPLNLANKEFLLMFVKEVKDRIYRVWCQNFDFDFSNWDKSRVDEIKGLCFEFIYKKDIPKQMELFNTGTSIFEYDLEDICITDFGLENLRFTTEKFIPITSFKEFQTKLPKLYALYEQQVKNIID